VKESYSHQNIKVFSDNICNIQLRGIPHQDGEHQAHAVSLIVLAGTRKYIMIMTMITIINSMASVREQPSDRRLSAKLVPELEWTLFQIHYFSENLAEPEVEPRPLGL
jgi:hypothetical protein